MIIFPILNFFLEQNFVTYVFYAIFSFAVIRTIFWR